MGTVSPFSLVNKRKIDEKGMKTIFKAITDLSTGEIMYLIDDNGGSEIYYAQKTASVP